MFGSNLYSSYLPTAISFSTQRAGRGTMGNSSSVKYNISPEELKSIRKVLLLCLSAIKAVLLCFAVLVLSSNAYPVMRPGLPWARSPGSTTGSRFWTREGRDIWRGRTSSIYQSSVSTLSVTGLFTQSSPTTQLFRT